MSIKIFSDTIDVAVVGLTNSGKSTFISSLFNSNKIPDTINISELRNNNGGLTKVTTYYSLTDCETIEVIDVIFNIGNLTRGIAETDVESINKKLANKEYRNFDIDPVTTNEKGFYKDSLEANLNKLATKIKSSFDTAVKYINMPSADLLIKSIKINVPASEKVLEIMSKYRFTTVVLRDTRGFLDANLSDLQQKTPTLADSGLDGIQACIFMNGQDSVMPNLGRELYGEFVKSIFESVPTFIVERSAKLAGKLEDCLDDNISFDPGIYNGLVNNKRITNLNFNEIHKFLNTLGIINENGISANQLIDVHKRELLLPEVSMLKSPSSSPDDDYIIYEFCVLEVLDSLLSTLSDFRSLLNKVMTFFDKPNQLNAIHQKFFSVFYESFFISIAKEYYDYYQHNYQLVRPVTQGYSKDNLLYNLAHNQLLGNRGGITTRSSDNIYLYGSTGVFAATSWNILSILISKLNTFTQITDEIRNFIDDTNEKIVELYILEIQQCLRYVLQNSFTDINAHFGGYPITERYQTVRSLEEMRNQWNFEYKKKFGENSINSVYLTNIKTDLELLMPNYSLQSIDYVRFSQLFWSFSIMIKHFFELVSNNTIMSKTNEILSV